MAEFRQLAGGEMQRLSVAEFAAASRHPVTLLLHNVRSMWNVGSMFRTADAAGIAGIVLCGYTATPPRKEISKTALGADETVPWIHVHDPVEAVALLRAQSMRVMALEIATGSVPYTSVPADQFPVCLVVGNEVEGIEERVLGCCDGVLEIPQYGTKHSLNVAVAAGVALFELVRSYRSGLG